MHESDDGEDLVRRQDVVMRRVRLVAAVLAVVQFAVYTAPGDLEVPWPQVEVGILVGLALLAISAAAWALGRHGSARALHVSGVAQLVADSVVCLAVIWAFGFEPGSMVWALMLLPVLEGALRFGLPGALATWAVLAGGFVAGEAWADEIYGHVTLRLSDVTFVVGLTGVIAFGVGSLAWHLEARTHLHREAERRLASMVYMDALTRLPNRERLLGALDRFDGTGEDYAVAFIDLDRFKQVNDAHGHEAGDEVLRAVARRLEEAVRPTDLVARLAGDEFVVVLPGLGAGVGALEIAERLAEASRTTVATPDATVEVDASVGVAVGRGDATVGREVLREADAAMYAAKDAGVARPVVVDATGHGPVEIALDETGDGSPIPD